MKIDVYDLRQKINKLPSEMGYISKQSVKEIIDELEEEAKAEHDRLMRSTPIHSHGGWD